jgi:hypothetical protein
MTTVCSRHISEKNVSLFSLSAKYRQRDESNWWAKECFDNVGFDWKQSKNYGLKPYNFQEDSQVKASVVKNYYKLTPISEISRMASIASLVSIGIFLLIGMPFVALTGIIAFNAFKIAVTSGCLLLASSLLFGTSIVTSRAIREARLVFDPDFQQFAKNNLQKDGRLPDRESLLDPEIHRIYLNAWPTKDYGSKKDPSKYFNC